MTKLAICSAIAIALVMPCSAVAKNKHVRESVSASGSSPDWSVFVYAYEKLESDEDQAGVFFSVTDRQTGEGAFCDGDYQPFDTDLVKTSGSAKSGRIYPITCNDGGELSDEVTVSAECSFDGAFYRVFKESRGTTIVASAECTIHVDGDDVEGTGLIIRERIRGGSQ